MANGIHKIWAEIFVYKCFHIESELRIVLTVNGNRCVQTTPLVHCVRHLSKTTRIQAYENSAYMYNV